MPAKLLLIIVKYLMNSNLRLKNMAPVYTEEHTHVVTVHEPFLRISCETVRTIKKDGVKIGEARENKGYRPGEENEGACDLVLTIGEAIWTPEVIAEYQASQLLPPETARRTPASVNYMAEMMNANSSE